MKQVHAETLISIYSGLVKDVEHILMLESGQLLPDFQKISESVRSRGLSVFLLDLPKICSDLERSLEIGKWVGHGSLFCPLEGLPTIYEPLFSMIFTEGIDLDPSVDPIYITCLRQLLKVFKKYRIDPPHSKVQEKIHEFIEIEGHIARPNLSWGSADLSVVSKFPCLIDLGTNIIQQRDSSSPKGTDSLRSSASSELLRDLSGIQDLSDRLVRSFSFRSEWFKPKHGPGAVSERFRNSKFEFPSWPERLECKFPFSEFGLFNQTFWNYSPDQFKTDESPSKLIGVPKDYKGPRLIASEPISMQFIQQGMMAVLRKNVTNSVLRHSIDFRSQDPSKELALSASRTRDLSTIDLSSASDRLSCALVECIFRKNFVLLELFNACRTTAIKLPSGELLQINKFAAQGAAYTFPVQSIVYALICMGVIYSDNRQARLVDLAKSVRVFGDDMIVPSRYFTRISRVLESVGLKVNREKSFNEGFFRESCGMDAYLGIDVTSTSILDTFDPSDKETLVSVVEQSNNLYLRGYIECSRQLLETIPLDLRKSIPWKSPDSTVFGAIGSGKNRLPVKWCRKLHHYKTKTLAVETKVFSTKVDGHLRLFQWMIESPHPESVWTGGYVKGVLVDYRQRWVPSYLLGKG